MSELTDGTADIVGSEDELVYLDNGSQKENIEVIDQFNNDSGFTTNTGVLVTAGDGLSGGGSSGGVTVNVDIQGTALTMR